MYHHGPAFESELVAFRAYMDNRQSIDLYGKKYQRLELAETNFYLPLNIRLVPPSAASRATASCRTT